MTDPNRHMNSSTLTPVPAAEGEVPATALTLQQISEAVARGTLGDLNTLELTTAAITVTVARIAVERGEIAADPALLAARNAIWTERRRRAPAAEPDYSAEVPVKSNADASAGTVNPGIHSQSSPASSDWAPTADPPGDRAPREFAQVFKLRRERHPDGYRAETNYVSGSCAVMATALLNEMGGDLIMLVKRDEPELAFHFAVHRDGIVSDVDGHFELGTWRKAWADKFNKDLAVTRTTPALMEELMNVAPLGPERYAVGEADLALAAPLAKALADARGLDPAAWWIDPSRRIRPDEVLSRDADDAWRTALARGPMPAGPATTLHPSPVRADRRWIIPDPTPADGSDRPTASLKHRMAMIAGGTER